MGDLGSSQIICEGWVLKRRQDPNFFTDFFQRDEFQKRYLILTPTKLSYYHSKPVSLEAVESEIP